MSGWGTKHDIVYEKPSDATVRAYATQSAAFYNALHAKFDISFEDFSDRDAGFYEKVQGNPKTWFTPADFHRHLLYGATFVKLTGLRMVAWQIPLGNTVMRAMDDTWGHYQDNRVQWLLGAGSRAHLRAYANAGYVGFLFGGGADGTTCACDGRHDGVTNPAPINGNTKTSLSADDDGGYFRAQARAYYRAGAAPPAVGSAHGAAHRGRLPRRLDHGRVAALGSRRSPARAHRRRRRSDEPVGALGRAARAEAQVPQPRRLRRANRRDRRAARRCCARRRRARRAGRDQRRRATAAGRGGADATSRAWSRTGCTAGSRSPRRRRSRGTTATRELRGHRRPQRAGPGARRRAHRAAASLPRHARRPRASGADARRHERRRRSPVRRGPPSPRRASAPDPPGRFEL